MRPTSGAHATGARRQNVEPRSARRAALTRALTDDRDLGRTIGEILADYF